MRNRSLLKRTFAIVLAGILVFGNLSMSEATNTGQRQTAEQNNGTAKPEDIIYEEGKVVDASDKWNSQGGGAIDIHDGYYTNVYFKNEPFLNGHTDNWHNFIIETTHPEGIKGYTLRADAYGWAYGKEEELPEPTMSVVQSWDDDWTKFKQICAGDIIVSAYKYDTNILKFYIQFSSGDTMIYTLTYPEKVPEGLQFFVGGEYAKITQNKITFTESMPNSVGKITLDKQNAGIENEYVYASQEDLDADNYPAILYGSVDIAIEKLEAAEGEHLYFKDVRWKLSDTEKARLKVNEDGSVTVFATEQTNPGDKIIVTAYADTKVQVQCECTVYKMKRLEQCKVSTVTVEDQVLLMRYSDTGANVWDSVTINPVILPDDADIKQVEYTTQSDAIRIEGNTITGLKEGTATVTATSKSSSKVSCDFTVTVKKPKFGELTSDFTVGGFATDSSGWEKLTGDFYITYHFKNKSKDSTQNGFNFIFQLIDGKGKDTVLRADAYGKGTLHDGNDALTWSGVPGDWNDFKEVMKDADVSVTANRTGNQIEVKYHITGGENKVYDMAVTVSSAAGFPETLFGRITGENVEISDITLEDGIFAIPAGEDDTYTYEPANVFKTVKPDTPLVFAVTPTKGYKIKKVSYGDTALTAGTDGKYTIPAVTDRTKRVTVETELAKYPITYVVDGKTQAEKGEFTIADINHDKVALKPTGTINGWYASADDRATKITEFTAAEYMTEDGITVYGYMPYKVTLTPADTSSLKNGTIDAFDTTQSYYVGNKVSITTTPKAGFAADISVSYKNAEGQDMAVTTTKEIKDGKEIVSFIMPAANVTVTCAEFTGVDNSELVAAIEAAKAIYDGDNRDGVYSEASYTLFREAYEKALEAKDATTQAAVNTAKDNLVNAQKDLKSATKVILNKQTATITVGKTETLTATVTIENEDKSVTWSSSNDKVASVKDGVVMAVAEGEAVITAAAKDGTKADCKVTIVKASQGGNDKPVDSESSLKLGKTKVTLYTGKQTNSISIQTKVTGPSKTVKWTSKNKNVAKIVKNKIVAVRPGKTTVTATANNISKKVTVTVKNPTISMKKGKKRFKKSKLTIKKNKKVVLTVSLKPSKSGMSLWNLSKKDKKIASVTLKKGKLTIKGKKKGKLTVTIKSGKAAKKIKVTVKS